MRVVWCRYAIYLIPYLLFLGISPFLIAEDSTPSETPPVEKETEPIQLKKITVTPGQYAIYERASAKLSLSKKEIERFPLIDNDVMRAAHILPGVVASDYSARFSVRGGEKDDIAVRLDGMELYNPYHLQDFGGAVSLIGLGLIQGAELLMGGFPAEYGEKMSGVFDITTKTPNSEKISTNFGLDLINATALLEIPLSEKGGWLLSARRGYIDLILALMDIDDRYKPQYADVYGKFSYQLTPADTLTVNGLYGWDKNRIRADDVDNNLDSLYDNTTAWAKWRHSIGTSHWTDVFIFAGTASQERTTGTADFDGRDFSYVGGKVEATATFREADTFRSGISWRSLTADYAYDVRERQPGINQYKRIQVDFEDSGSEITAFLQHEWRPNLRVAVQLGGRYLFQNYRAANIQRYEFAPRVALAVRASENLLLRSAWGIYHQPIHLMGIPVEDGVKTVGRAEQAIHYIAGAEYTPAQNFSVRIEGYYNTFDNLVGRLREFGRQNQIFAPPESGNARGVDMYLTHAISRQWTWSLAYAYGRAKEVAGNETIFRQFDRRHSLGLSSSHQLSPTWHLYLSWRFYTGQPRTPLNHILVTLPNGSSTCDRQFGETHSARMPAYHSLDFRITKRSPYKRWELSWYFQILNLYNRTNLDEYAFSEIRDENTGNVIGCDIEEGPLFPIVPTLGITVTF